MIKYVISKDRGALSRRVPHVIRLPRLCGKGVGAEAGAVAGIFSWQYG
ncbi:MAG: hypothetical protein IJX92_05050 [Clostridia bacterium]|nr:hypothetical protein [Clostridia bacterium]